MKKIISVITILILLLVYLPTFVSADDGYQPLANTTYYVDTSFNSGTPGWHVTRWNNIHSAVENCTNSANDYTILVNGDGDVYNENVRVSTSQSYHTLNIVGNYTTTRPRVNGQGASKSTFELMNNKIAISGFTVYNTIGLPGSWHGIAIGKTLESMTEQNNITITNCYITQATEGVLLRGGKNFNISSNEIDSTSVGIWILGPVGDRKSFAYVYNNYIHGCTSGIVTYMSCNNTILRNTISSSISCGIDLQTSSNYNLIYYNLLNGASSGIKIYASGTYGCTNNLIYNNNFINNNPSIQVTPGPALRNFWNNSFPICGNYYSLLSGTDNYKGPSQNISGSDGIRDTSYTIATNNTDYYPYLHTFSGTYPNHYPTATTNNATNIGTTSATLNGILTDDGGEICTAGLDYGQTTGYGNTVKDDVYVYAGGTTANSVNKYLKNGMSFAAQTQNYGGTIWALAQDSTYIYAGGQTTNKVFQYWKSNMTKKAETTSYGGTIYALMQDSTYIYAGGRTPYKVFQYWKSNMTKKAETVSYGGEIWSLAIDDTYIYAGGGTINKVFQYWKSNMTKKAETGSYGGLIYSLTSDDTYVYAGGDNTQKVSQYWKSNMTYKTQTASYGGIITALTQDLTYVYAGGYTTRKVYQYWKSNMTKKAETTSYGGELWALAQDSTYIYAGGITIRTIRQYWKSNMTKKAETSSYQGDICALSSYDNYKVKGETLTFDVTGLSPGTLYHFRAFATNTIGTGYGSDKTFLTKPMPLTDFTAKPSITKIYLNWTNKAGGDGAYIEYAIDSMPSPWNPGSGTKVNTSGSIWGESFTHTGLEFGHTYYYKAWPFAYDGSISDGSSTKPYGDPSTLLTMGELSNLNPADNAVGVPTFLSTVSIDITFFGLFNWTIGGDNITTNSATDDTSGTKQANIISPLVSSTKYTWWVNVSVGEDYSNQSFTFTTRSPGVMGEGYYSQQRALARTSDGTLYAVYTDIDDTEILCSVSTDDGLTWMETSLVQATYNVYEPTIAVDSNNAIYVFWLEWDGTTQIKYCVYDGSWSGAEYFTTDENYSLSLAIAVNSTNYVHVVWGYELGGGTQLREGWLSYYTDTISTPEPIAFSPTGNIEHPTIAIDENDVVHVAWDETIFLGEETYSLQIMYSYNDGSWSQIYNVTEFDSLRECVTPSIVVDEDVVHIVWRNALWDIYEGLVNVTYQYRSFNGSWGDIKDIYAYDNIQESQSFSLSRDATNLYAVFDGQDEEGNPAILYSTYGGDTWSSAVFIKNVNSFGRPNLIFAQHPIISGAEINIPETGFAFIYANVTEILQGNYINYYSNATWQELIEEPTSFTATAINRFRIDLSWTKGDKADRTYVVAKLNSYPASRADGTNIYNGTGTNYPHTGLTPSQHWFYRAWSWNQTDKAYSDTYSSANTTTLSNIAPNYGIPSPTNNSNNQPKSLTWGIPINDANGDTFTWWINCSNGQKSSATGTNGTKQLVLSDLSYLTTYKVWVNSTDIYGGTTRQWYQFTTLSNGLPTYGTPNPANNSINQLLSLTWSIPINDPNGDIFSWWINCSNGQKSSGTGATNGTKQLSISGLLCSITYKIWVNSTDIYSGSTHAWYQFTTRAQYIPSSPPSFTATAYNRTRIDLSWTKGSKADRTYIEAKLGSYPTSRADGTNIYNGTGLSCSHTGLSQSQHWFYRAWSWNITDSVWNTSYAQADTTTIANNPPVFNSPSPFNNSIGQDIAFIWSIHISDPEGDLFNWTIDCSNGQSNSANANINGIKSLSLSGLEYNTTYTIWVNATDGTNWTHEWYTFATRTANEPGPPSSFTATAITRFRIDISWAKGTNADYTYVEAKLGSYPTSRIGTNIYNGTDISYSHTGLNPNQHWYYCAWSWNITDNIWSTGYAQIDTTPILNNPPNYGIPSPTNGSTGLELAFTWNITIQDQEGDLFNWTIECSNSQSNSANDDTNGSEELSLSGLFYSTEYKVWVNATDGYSWTYAWYTFTTEANTIPVISDENPTNNSITQPLTLTWNCTITDPDEPMDWSIECSNDQTASGTSSTGNIQVLLSSLSYSTTYTIWTNVTDGVDIISEWFVFTTMNIPNKPPNQPTNEYPTNNSVYIMPETTYMNITVSDPDGDEITVVFKWQNGTTIATLTNITNNSLASIYLSDYQIIAHDTTHYWYIVVGDSIENTTGPIWNFHTSKAWDLNGDKAMNYLDLSILVSNYLKHMTAGSQSWDINNDGVCNYLDLSAVVSHYGENY